MTTQLVAVAALLFGSAFLLTAGGIHSLLLPVRGAIEGFTVAELGLIGTGWAVGFVAGCLVVPAIVRRVGHVRSYSVMASLAAVAILLNLLIVSPPSWILLRALSGFCFAGAFMIVESWLNERSTQESRGTIFSVYQIVNFIALTAGQLTLAIREPTDHFFFTIGAIFYCLAILPTALSRAESPRPLKTARLDVRALFANSPVAAVGCFLIGNVNGAFGTLGAVYGNQIGLSIASIAFMMAGSLLGGSLIQFPLGWLSDRTDRRRVLVATAFGAALIGIALLLVRPRSPELVIGLILLFGGMIYPMYALAVAHANDFAAPDDFVKIAGGLLLLYGVGTMSGPLFGAMAMEWISAEGLFAFCALVHLALGLYTLFRMRRRAAPDLATRETFQGMPAPRIVTPESVALDPRATESTEEPPPH
jgi:MFS family permease